MSFPQVALGPPVRQAETLQQRQPAVSVSFLKVALGRLAQREEATPQHRPLVTMVSASFQNQAHGRLVPRAAIHHHERQVTVSFHRQGRGRLVPQVEAVQQRPNRSQTAS